MKNILFTFLLLFPALINAQININGDFESHGAGGKPTGWLLASNKEQEKDYTVKVDSLVKQGGRVSVSISQVTPTGRFGAISNAVTKIFTGSQIELKGFVRTAGVASGYAGMWLRLDGEENTLVAFDNMQKNGIRGTTEWKQYSIKLPYNSETVRSIVFGGILIGDGTAWFDNFELLLDGKPIAMVPERALTKLDTDTAFRKRSRIDVISVNPQSLINLTLTGQLWGFLKYHHPAVAKGEYNWDAELFRLMPAVMNAPDNRSLSDALENYLDKLPVPALCEKCREKVPSNVHFRPDYGRLLDNSTLSPSLTKKLQYILDNRNTGPNFYIAMEPVGNPGFKNELSYPSMKFPDAGYRVLSLYRYWAMINYFFPYKNVIGKDWNQVLTASLPGFINAKNETEYTLEVLKIIASINDTHANVWGQNKALESMKGRFAAPFQARFIENSLVVTGFYDDASAAWKLSKGDIIVSINGKKVTDLVKEFLPLTAASNYDTQLRDLPGNYLLRSNSNEFVFGLQHNGISSEITVPGISSAAIYRNLDYTKKESFFLQTEDIGYIYPGKYKNTELPAIKKLFAKTNGIIVDMRSYPSDFMPFTFGNYIKDKKAPFVKFSFGRVEQPGMFLYSKPLSNGGIKGDTYKGKVIVIVNATSQSQAEYTTMAFQSSPNVKVIGSTTAGADGNVSSIVLPGGITTMISGLGIFYPDNSPTQREGVKIDQVVYPTIKGIKEGRDELLDKAIEMIRSN